MDKNYGIIQEIDYYLILYAVLMDRILYLADIQPKHRLISYINSKKNQKMRY